MARLVTVKRLDGQTRQVDLDRCECGDFRVNGVPLLAFAKTGLLTALYEGLGWYPHNPTLYRAENPDDSPLVFVSVVGSLIPRLAPHCFEVAPRHIEEILTFINADEMTREHWLGTPFATAPKPVTTAKPKSSRRGRTPGKRTKTDHALEILQRRLKDGDSVDISLIAREAGIKDTRTLTRPGKFMRFYSSSIKAWEANQKAHRAIGLGRPIARPKRGRTITQDAEPATWDDEPDDDEDWESKIDEHGFSMPDDDGE
jgi:hypothetical protein